MELLVAADVEIAALTELSNELPGRGWPLTVANQRISTKIPGGNPESFIRLFTVGGLERDLVSDTPTLIVEAFHKSEQDARDLCALAVAILQAAGRRGKIGGAVCYGVDVSGLPGNLPHPNVPEKFRFTATLNVVLRKINY